MSISSRKSRYYLNIKPSSFVISGTFKTEYSISFKKNSYCEIEPNESAKKATELVKGKYTTGSFGSDGSAPKGEECDFYKFEVKKGCYYAVQFKDYENIADSTTIDQYLNKSGKRFIPDEVVMPNGNTAFAFKAEESGYYYLKLDNWSGAQYTYKVTYTDYTSKEEPV